MLTGSMKRQVWSQITSNADRHSMFLKIWNSLGGRLDSILQTLQFGVTFNANAEDASGRKGADVVFGNLPTEIGQPVEKDGKTTVEWRPIRWTDLPLFFRSAQDVVRLVNKALVSETRILSMKWTKLDDPSAMQEIAEKLADKDRQLEAIAAEKDAQTAEIEKLRAELAAKTPARARK